jgi:signal peptidase I
VRILDRSLSRLPRRVRTLLDWSATITVAVVAVLLFHAEVAKPYRVPSASMEPTLHCAKPADGCRARFSDRVIADRIVYRFHPPERGDIIVFKAPAKVQAACDAGGAFVKRIVGLPGEQVSMRDGRVLINGIPLQEPYLTPDYRGHANGLWPRSSRDGYFVLGDNRTMSCDSRRWGVVPRDNIIGRAELRYWPPNRIGNSANVRSSFRPAAFVAVDADHEEGNPLRDAGRGRHLRRCRALRLSDKCPAGKGGSPPDSALR